MMKRGLSSAEVQQLLKKHGYNELPTAKPKNIGRIALEVMKEPMFLLLLSCGVLYMLLGDFREGIIMLSTISVIIFITFYQYQKTEKALDALRNLSAPRALVLRDGITVRIPGREVVPGDVLILNEGDRVAADARLFDSINLTVDESLLTGESIPVNKDPQHKDESYRRVFSGTLVVQGKGHAEVLATGVETKFGQIGVSLESINQDETRLQKEMKVLIRNLFIIGMVISIVVVAAFYITRGNFIQSLLNGLAAAMAILPEEFPVVLTVFLALGAWRLSKKNVLTRKPTAIETLGAATVLCSDKTGTITQNKMEVAELYNGKEILQKNIFSEKKKDIESLVKASMFASPKDTVDPMEKAIGALFNSINEQDSTEYQLIKEYPLSPNFFAMTWVVEDIQSHEYLVFAKGSPEAMFSLCRLNEQETAAYLLQVNEMAARGYRVIAVATATIESKLLPENQQDFRFQFLGLMGFEDPVRPEAAQAIKECHEAGVKVIMITGDFPITAKSIAKQIGLPFQEVMTGTDLNILNDAELREKIKNTHVFARVIPEQKLRIVEALKANNEIVAMTGDGVNDAPALKAAHIGIAMGQRGTDVAREASSLVLLDDNFASIVSAIRSGRRIFDNLQKAMSYIIAIHIPIIGLTLMPAFLTWLPLLLMPLHIVFMELIIDPVCSVAFESEQEEKGIMKRPPRNPNELFFGGRKIFLSALQGLLLLAMVLIVYFLSINEGHSEGEVRAIAFSSLILGNVFFILTKLSKTRSVISVITEKNIAAMLILSLAVIMLLLIISVPGLQYIFSFEFPGLYHFIPSVAGAFLVLIVLESAKLVSSKLNLSR